MSLERTAARFGAVALAVSAGNAHLRRAEETLRRESSPLVNLTPDGSGGQVECAVSQPVEVDRPVIVFETGLGACMDSWDWLVQLLGDDYWIVRYHRRGHGRTRSVLRPWELVTRVLDQAGLADRPVHLVGHSLGGLIIGNTLHEAPELAARARSVTMIDSTDADLLASERADREKVRRFRQYCFQEGFAAATGLGRWTPSPVESEVNFRAAIQRAFLTESTRPRTLLTAIREHAHEPLNGQRHLARLPASRMVIAASDNAVQQRRLAEKVSARFEVIPDSSHRSVIGRFAPAKKVAALVREMAG